MNFSKKSFDKAVMANATFRAVRLATEILESARSFEADSNKRYRLEKHECKTCFYFRSNRIGGAAMTTQPCAICSEAMLFGNTATSLICLNCAKQHKLCRHCGADSELRPKRRLPVPTSPADPKPEEKTDQAPTMHLLPLRKGPTK